MKVLITGATGFLGNSVAKKIIEEYPNYEVYGLGRNQNKMLNIKNLNWIKGDLSDKEFTLRLQKENFNIIIHCAALSNTYGVYDEFYKSNILSTENIIQLAKKNNALLIYISTPSIFAKDKNQYDIVEDSEIDFDYIKNSNYISTKYESEIKVKKSLEKAYILRPRAIFGKNDTTIWPKLMKANKKIGVPIFREGKVKLSFTYIDSITNFICKLMVEEPKEVEIYNLCDGNIEIKEALEIFQKYADFPVKGAKVSFNLLKKLAKFLKIITPKTKEPVVSEETLSLLYYDMTFNTEKAVKKGYKSLKSFDEIIEDNMKSWDGEKNLWKI